MYNFILDSLGVIIFIVITYILSAGAMIMLIDNLKNKKLTRNVFFYFKFGWAIYPYYIILFLTNPKKYLNVFLNEDNE